MSVGDDVVLAVPVVIEEELQVAGRRIENLVEEECDEVAQLLLEPFVLPYTVEVGVGFQDVQVGVHRLAFVLILCAESHVGNLLPGAAERFAIAVFYRVKAVGLNAFKEADGNL